MKELIGFVAAAMLLVSFINQAKADELSDNVQACENGAAAVREFHTRAQDYGDLDFTQYRADVNEGLARSDYSENGKSALRILSAVGWFARKGTQEAATDGFVGNCLDGIERRTIEAERKRRLDWFTS